MNFICHTVCKNARKSLLNPFSSQMRFMSIDATKYPVQQTKRDIFTTTQMSPALSVSTSATTGINTVPNHLRYYSVSAGDIQEVDVEEFLGFHKDSYQLIDVRQQHEWDEDHIEGATLIPLDQILNNQADLEMLRNKPCVIYCKAGIRSNMACTALREFGVRAVNLNGGILAYRAVE